MSPPLSLTGYFIAVGATLLALVVTLLMWPILQGSPFMVFFLAVLVSAWYGGLGPGLFATALTMLLAAYFFAAPVNSLLVSDPAVIARLGLFGLAAGLVTLFSNSRRQALVDLKHIQQEQFALMERERQARQAAEAANRAKDVFLATVSHELRNPLSAMLGWVQVLRRRSADGATTERALEIIERNAKLQDQLIEDLLDVSRIVSGQLRLNACPSDLLPVVEAAIDVVQPAAQAKSIRLLRMLDPAAGPVLADATRIQQVVWNLLSKCDQIHPPGRARRGPPGPHRRPCRTFGKRHRPRHRRRSAAPAVRAFLAGRRRHLEAPRRLGIGAGYHPQTGGDARR